LPTALALADLLEQRSSAAATTIAAVTQQLRYSATETAQHTKT
jgi:hypothetical protein